MDGVRRAKETVRTQQRQYETAQADYDALCAEIEAIDAETEQVQAEMQRLMVEVERCNAAIRAITEEQAGDVYKRQIVDRGYVEREQKKLKPTVLGRTINELMLAEFAPIVDVAFSADMEKNLDKVESGKADWHDIIDQFYKPFAASLEKAEKDMEGKKIKVPDEETDEILSLIHISRAGKPRPGELPGGGARGRKAGGGRLPPGCVRRVRTPRRPL